MTAPGTSATSKPSNAAIARLRKIAATGKPSVRLQAIDVLAASCGLYKTKATQSYAEYPSTRAAKIVARLLRALLKMPMARPIIRSGCEQRLLLIESGVELDPKTVWREKPEAEAIPQTPTESDEDATVRRMLAEVFAHRKKTEEVEVGGIDA